MANPSKARDMPLGTAPIFALIIGIDLYQHQSIENLQGAVNDARAIKTYLEQDLGVSHDHIIYLENELATRERIIGAFIDLSNLPELVSKTPVLIYFAGHGVRVVDNAGKETMEAFIPYDCDSFSGGLIHPIVDKTISSLVESIYNKVGDNITFISDCCHSGSLTRGDEPNVRGLRVPRSYRYPTDLDIELISKILPYGSRASASQTHVSLAACGAQELAKEACSTGRWHGEFTSALLLLLKSTSINRLTPDDVLFRLAHGAVSQQSPQCRGQNSLRYFFQGEAPALMWYRVTYSASTPVYELNGGLVHGISEGDTFRVFTDRNVETFLGLATTTEVKPFQSSLKPDHVPTHNGFALLHQVGDFARPKVFIRELPQGSGPISRALEVISRQAAHVYPTSCKHRESSFSLCEEVDGTVTVANLDNLLSYPHSPHYLSIRIPADTDKIRNILPHVAQFFYHLKNKSPEADQTFGIELEVRQVAQIITPPPHFKRTCRFITPGENLIKEGALDVFGSQTALYGFRLRNNSDRDSFVTILYFDGAQYTIDKLYGSQSGGNYQVDCPLPGSGELKLGYGSGVKEINPFLLDVSDKGQHREFGVFKLIFTSKAVDLANICSTSSLQAVASRGLIKGPHLEFESLQDEWHTLYIPVIITRAEEGGS